MLAEIEAVLREGETLSELVETAIDKEVKLRLACAESDARAAELAKLELKPLFTFDQVDNTLANMIEAARRRRAAEDAAAASSLGGKGTGRPRGSKNLLANE